MYNTWKSISSLQKIKLTNVVPQQGEHGSVAASTVFKTQPHINVGVVCSPAR